jgi:hypothetical protein
MTSLSQHRYWDHANNNVVIEGYRLQVTPTTLATMSFQLQMWKVQDNGGGRCTIVPMEDITTKSVSPRITDSLRTGANDRSYDTAALYTTTIPGVMKQGDFSKYFKSRENYIMGSNKNEGLIVKITHVNIDYITGVIDYRHVDD